MKPHWLLYVQKMDTMLGEAFRLCCKNSLQKMLHVLTGDGTTGPTPLVSVSVSLQNQKVGLLVKISMFEVNLLYTR